MKSSPLLKTIAIFLTVILIAPSTFLIAPHRAQAIWGVGDITFDPTNYVANYGTWVETALGVVKSTLIEAHTYTSMVAEYAMYINAYVLQPLAFVMSGNLLKAMTSGVISFVIGKTNGTGAPQFVQNLQGNLQTVGDTQALAFFAQFGENSNSPFAASINSSLRTNYLQNTSLAGFWAANQCTLSGSSPNVNAFLAGNWSQGGAAAWFALTTQDQNNPYTLYQKSQSQLGSMVASAVSSRLSQLSWGQGFMSWCGSTPSGGGSCVANSNGVCPSGCVPDDNAASGCSPAKAGTNPGDPCTNSDGSPGTIKTPGSVILATLNKVLGSTQDKLVQMGQLASEITSILGDVATVAQTAQLASQILGGSNSQGLFGADQTIDNSQGFLGVTNSTVLKDSAALQMSCTDMLARVDKYKSAWNIISAAANAALTSVTDLANYCTAQHDLAVSASGSSYAAFITSSAAQAASARTALTTYIAPVIDQAATAASASAAAIFMVNKIQSELNSITATSTGNEYAADIVTLKTMAPSDDDVVIVQQRAKSFNGWGIAATPDGSLNITGNQGSSTVDLMNFLKQNADALKASCTLPVAGI